MSFEAFSQTFWDGGDTSSLKAVCLTEPSKDLLGSVLPKEFPGNSLSKDYATVLLQQLSSGTISPRDLDVNARELVLSHCREQVEARHQRKDENSLGSDAGGPKNKVLRDSLVLKGQSPQSVFLPTASASANPSTLASSSENSTGFQSSMFHGGFTTRSNAENAESAFRSFNASKISPHVRPAGLGGALIACQGSPGGNMGVSTGSMVPTALISSLKTESGEVLKDSYNIRTDKSQQLMSSGSGGAFVSSQASTGFQYRGAQMVPAIGPLAVSPDVPLHVPSSAMVPSLNPGALARQQRASADTKRGKRRRALVDQKTGPGNGSSSDANPGLAQIVPSQKVELPPIVKVKEERKNKRLLRNRVSAQQARERKRQHMTELEEHCNEIEVKNTEIEEQIIRLQMENDGLRQIVKENMRARGGNREVNDGNGLCHLQNEMGVMDKFNQIVVPKEEDIIQGFSALSDPLVINGIEGDGTLDSHFNELRRLASVRVEGNLPDEIDLYPNGNVV